VGELRFDGAVEIVQAGVVGDVEGRDEIGDFLNVGDEGVFEFGLGVGQAFSHAGEGFGDALEEIDHGVFLGGLDLLAEVFLDVGEIGG